MNSGTTKNIRDTHGLAGAVRTCFRCAPGAASAKLAVETVNGALSPLALLAVASFIDSALAYVDKSGKITPVVIYIALIAVFYAFSQVSQVVVRFADAALDNALRENLRPQLLIKQSRVSYPLLENPETADLITLVCDNVEKRMAEILNTGAGLIRVIIQTAGALSILAAHIWWSLPLFAATAVPITLIARKGGKAIYESDAVTTVLTRRHYYLSSILTGRETAAERALFGYTDAVNKKFSEAHLKRSNLVTKEIALEEASISACEFILHAIVAVIIFALLIPAGKGEISHGLYISLAGALIGLARTMTGSVSRLIGGVTGFIAYMRDYERFFALPETGPDAKHIKDAGFGAGAGASSGAESGISVAADARADSGGAVVPSESVPDTCANPRTDGSFARLEIRNLRFRYTPDGDYILDGVDIVMERGRTYSLIGRNGAGKSTLVKILLGLYRDFEGEILIDGKDISEYGAGGLRRVFSAVYQDFAKYYIPFRRNITIGNPRGGDFEEALRLAELEGVAAGLPQGVDTPLGKIYDGGADISGGEWQKIAIARAIYADAPFIILDEPAAGLSPTAENKLYKSFAEIVKNKTALLISHRLGSTKLSDMLFVLDGGVIAEAGTHDELMAANGVYAGMFVSQRSWYDERG